MASLRERTSAGATTYQVLFRHGTKQRSWSFKTRPAATRFIARIDLDGVDAALTWLHEQDNPKKAGLTLDELAEKWLTARAADVAAGALTPRVLTGYRRDYENWIGKVVGKPGLGHLPAESITERHVQDWVDRIKVMPKSSPKSVGDRHAILHGIFKWASDPRHGHIKAGHNPCVGTKLPKKVKTLPKGLRMSELAALTATARTTNPPAADLIDFIVGTGWRIGESIALTAGQVEDDGTTVYVTMSRVWRREVGYVESAKSTASMRRLRVLGDAVGVLRRRTKDLSPADLVFTTSKGVPWDESGFRRDHFAKIAKTAGLVGDRRPTPHWLRHSHVLVCHAAGMSLAEIQRRIGHDDIKMTMNTYGRLIDDMNDDVAARLEQLLTTRPAAKDIIEGQVLSELT